MKTAVWRLVFGACLATMVFFGIGEAYAQASLPATQNYTRFLETLDRSDCVSIVKARDEYIARFSGAAEKDAADGFLLFKAFGEGVADTLGKRLFYKKLYPGMVDNPSYRRDYSNALNAINQTIHNGEWFSVSEKNDTGYILLFERLDNSTKETLRKTHGAALAELAAYTQYGLHVRVWERYYFALDPGFLIEASAPVTGETGEYIRFRIAEDWQRVLSEGFLAMSWDDLANRIVRWETIGREHPDLPETATVIAKEINRCLTFYLNGVWYTPAIDESGRLVDAMKTSYERFIAENGGSGHHALVKGVYDIWKKNDFTMSNDILSYLQQHAIETCILRERIDVK